MEHFTTDGDLDLDLIERYFSGALDAAEGETFERWMSVHPTRRRAVEDLRSVWTRAGRGEGWDVDGIWQALVARMRVADSSDVTHPAVNTRSISGGLPAHEKFVRSDRRGRGGWGTQPLRRGMWSIATALGLGLVVLVVGWTAGVRHSSQRPAQSNLAYTTGNGERATVTLPDGGTVALNVASRLEVPTDYMAGNHAVRLVGEGLFTVSHHEGSPLTVLAGATTTRVLGTSFIVRHYTTDTTTLVAVREGKVAVGAAVVTAAHAVEVGRTGVSRVRPSDTSLFTFAAGVLTLNGFPMSAAILELDQWYDADVRLGSPTLAGKQITGGFTTGSLADLAEDLEFALDVRVVRDGRVLTLFPKR